MLNQTLPALTPGDKIGILYSHYNANNKNITGSIPVHNGMFLSNEGNGIILVLHASKFPLTTPPKPVYDQICFYPLKLQCPAFKRDHYIWRQVFRYPTIVPPSPPGVAHPTPATFIGKAVGRLIAWRVAGLGGPEAGEGNTHNGAFIAYQATPTEPLSFGEAGLTKAIAGAPSQHKTNVLYIFHLNWDAAKKIPFFQVEAVTDVKAVAITHFQAPTKSCKPLGCTVSWKMHEPLTPEQSFVYRP